MKKFFRLLLVATYVTICAHDKNMLLEHINSYIASHGIDDSSIDAHRLRGSMYLDMGKFQEALTDYDFVITYQPQDFKSHFRKADALIAQGKFDDAIAVYQPLLQKNHILDPAQLGLTYCYLSKGDLANAWATGEWNSKKNKPYGSHLRTLLKTNTIAGKTIVLISKNGFGDTIQFIRYAEPLKRMGATVLVCVPQELLPLLSSNPYIDQLYSCEEIPMHNASADITSMAAILHDTVDTTIPNKIPYLFADERLCTYWQEKLQHDTNFKIGICWQASPQHEVLYPPTKQRSMPLTQFFKCKDIPGISWYSLQQVDGLDQLAQIPPDFKLHVFPDDFDKTHGIFMDTAAVIANLDLVISVDTATAHLAGALGKPVWLLLPYVSDARWTYGCTDSMWYPYHHIFKQPEPFDWDSVIATILKELSAHVKNK
ncbi:MAG TPA: tetratricopeptide repeat protein [Candidatus Dependentiae bacterium]|nr:tetratricopeptide repeat protein [Candidatus Dependentiae bacterium]HRQ62270.1 tetratricopeptide repeat protein [Candidatus Dependentiae bacterium]